MVCVLLHYLLEARQIKNNQVTKYLKETRGYTDEIIKSCGIGYLPNKKELIAYLEQNGLDKSKAEDLLKALGCIGYSHKMVIPFYDKEGSLMGLAARNIKYTDESKFGKYIYSKGLARSSTMLGIEYIDSKRPITIVEGMLDALHAKARRIDNVVAIGGTGMNIKQLELIEELSIAKVNLCLDNDKAGIEATKNIAYMINERNPDIEIRQVNMPKGIKDLDQLIQEKGNKAAENIIKQSKEISQYEIAEEREMKMLEKFQKKKDGYEYELEYKAFRPR